MSDLTNPPVPAQDPLAEQPISGGQSATTAMTVTSPVPAAPAGSGPIGQVRSTGTCILLTVVTFGIYSWVWYFKTHEEMKRHTGQGIGGGLALVLAFFVGIVMPFISSSEVGGLYTRRGQTPPVTATTGLWYVLLAWLFLVGPIVWFVKTNAALNDYWRSVGATAA